MLFSHDIPKNADAAIFDNEFEGVVFEPDFDIAEPRSRVVDGVIKHLGEGEI